MLDRERQQRKDSPPDHIRRLRTLGSGRAATAELVEASWGDGRRERYVEKVFSPGRLTRLIYRVAFAAPFAYQSNRHAILASFYRRRVISALLEAQALCADTPTRVNVARPAYVRYDHARNAWILAAEFIEGRGPIPRSLIPTESQPTDEMSDLIGQMKQIESQLIEWGLLGSGWQVAPQAWVSTANLLIPKHAKLRIFVPTCEAGKSVPVETHYSIIDLESGIPAVLLWRYLWLSWTRGSLFPFDDLDPQRLTEASERIANQLAQRGEVARAADLRLDVTSLLEADLHWKASELAPWRKPWSWLSTQRRDAYRQGCIDRWQQQRSIDTKAVTDLKSNSFLFAVLWTIGALAPASLGRWLRAYVGNQQHRQRVRRFVTDARCRSVFWERYRSKNIRCWIEQERCTRKSRPVSQVSFFAHRLLGRLTPAPVHRYCVDSYRRNRRNRQVRAFLTRRSYQAAWGRKFFGSTLARWQSRDWLTDAQAMELRSQFNGPQMSVYSRGFAMHLAIKLLYPLIAPLKVGGIAVTVAGGSLWYAVAPLMALPFLRTVVTVTSMLRYRAHRIPHGHAICIGLIPTVGSAAFAAQMWTVNQQLSIFLLRDTASRLARKIPIYGGPDSRTEHAVIAVTDRAIQCVIQMANLPSKYQSTLARQTNLQEENPTVNVLQHQRLG